jgi:exodeoxyribonuclease VII small subunit
MATLTYKKASEELEKIVMEIESGKVSIDLLYDKIKRANELIEFCQTALRKTETEISKLLPAKGKK